ncbi:MAG: hypothetical protein ACWA44_15015 [Thiotrichales bacterium]
MLPSHYKSISQIEKEDISKGTLSNWRKNARAQGRLMPDGDISPSGWDASDKFAAVPETAAMNEAELSVYCREKGFCPEQLTEWRAACELANDGDRAQTQQRKTVRRTDEQPINELERELRQKEQALAETSALLVPRKKAQLLRDCEEPNLILGYYLTCLYHCWLVLPTVSGDGYLQSQGPWLGDP